MKERGGRMTVPFFWSILPILLPAAAAKVKQIGSHISSLKTQKSKRREQKKERDWEEEIKKSEGELRFTLEHCLEIFAPTTQVSPLSSISNERQAHQESPWDLITWGSDAPTPFFTCLRAKLWLLGVSFFHLISYLYLYLTLFRVLEKEKMKKIKNKKPLISVFRPLIKVTG